MNLTTRKSGGRKGARLGQHFLTRPEIARWVADAVELTHDDMVLEIGPGHGILTRELLALAGKVVAVEKDPALVAELKETFVEQIAEGKLVLLEEDVRDFDPATRKELQGGYKVAANIPYYITGYIIRKFLTTVHQPKSLAVLIQKEVAERVVAKNGKESLLSLSVKAYGTPSVTHVVKAGAFSPPPKVDSAILVVGDIQRTCFHSKVHEENFFELLHIAFQNKRKQLGVTLRDYFLKHPDAILLKKARPEDMPLESWLEASRKIIK